MRRAFGGVHVVVLSIVIVGFGLVSVGCEGGETAPTEAIPSDERPRVRATTPADGGAVDCVDDDACEEEAVERACSADDTCPEGQSCSEGVCVDGAIPGTCSEDLDCPEGERCLESQCRADVGGPETPTCTSDEECALDQLCVEGACQQAPPTPACSLDGECDHGEICVEGACVLAPETGACTADVECAEGNYCVEGECVDTLASECASDDECAADELCIDGACEAPATATCIVSGCSSEICAPVAEITSCDVEPWFECLKYTQCGAFGPEGTCAWEESPAYLDCLDALVSQPECVSDSDCPAGEVCDGGTCGVAPECTSDAECSESEWCVQGECLPLLASCGSDADCPAGQACINGACEPAIAGCNSDADCPPGMGCSNGTCKPKEAPTCTTDADCAPSGLCVNGFCKELPPSLCTTDAECPDGFVCTPTGMCKALPPEEECTSDADCQPFESCVAGACIIELIECETSLDCPEGYTCTSTGICKPPAAGSCTSDDECPGGQECVDGACKPPIISVGCEDATQCNPAQACVDGECVPGGQGSACPNGDVDCAEGFECDCVYPVGCEDGSCGVLCKNKCVPEGSAQEPTACMMDTDCPEAMICDTDGPCLPNPECGPIAISIFGKLSTSMPK